MEVVQEDDRPGPQASLDVPDDRPDAGVRDVIPRVDVPEHLDEPEPERDAVVLRAHQLEPDEPVRQARQMGVRPRVVADAAQPRLRVRGVRPVCEPVADVEERRVRPASLQDPQQLRRVRARPVVEGQRDRVTVTAAARDDLPPVEHLLQRVVLRPCGWKAGPPMPRRWSLRRRHRRRDEGDEEQGGEQGSHHIRSLSASTFATNGFETLYTPCSLTARSPWYQPASASDSFPWNTCNRWRR